VAKCEGRELLMHPNGMGTLSFDASLHPYMADLEKPGRWQVYAPSTNWSQGGPIIEREIVSIDKEEGGKRWAAFAWRSDRDLQRAIGPTPLIAAMRCYVASKLGDTVEVPNELL